MSESRRMLSLPHKWNMRFMQMAELISSWSKDPRKQIGAVVVEPITRRILATGYNGFPRGIEDSEERLATSEEKSKYVVHAESNAIYNATWSGISLNHAHLYVYGLPICPECAKSIIQVGIDQVYVRFDANLDEDIRWINAYALTKTLLVEAKVRITQL